ncbi:MAG: phospholipid carrier-dependent glycosyltransferase [Lachnospiraceae bacterium]|nr:phospholipid carrier-dependent glycosyltransferase [Lachnospiraceae bacterium]
MNQLHIWIVLSFFFMIALWKVAINRLQGEKKDVGKFTVPLLFLLAFVLRIVLSVTYYGFETDVNCFMSWSERIYTLGPANFYSPDYFSDYPPLYLYVLFTVSLLRHVLGITYGSTLHLLLIKTPAILADMAIGYLIYRVGRKRIGLSSTICLSALYLFQPVVLLNSCLWGQVDSVFTLFLLLSILFLEKMQLLPSMLLFELGVLMKPQMLIFAPVMIVGVIHYVFRGSFSMQMFTKAVGYGLLTLLVMVLLSMPFGLENVLSQYLDTLGSYPYASVNGYNFWAGMGMNWKSQELTFCGLQCTAWGYIAIVLTAAFAIVLGLRLGNLPEKHYVVGAFLILSMFTFSVRMHERYLYPFIPLALMGFIGFSSRQINSIPASDKDKNAAGYLSSALRFGYPSVFLMITLLHLYNAGNVLFFFDTKGHASDDPGIKFAGIFMVVCALCFYLLMIQLQMKKEIALVRESKVFRTSQSALRLRPDSLRMTRVDLLLMIFITLLYSCFALRDLGDRVAPESVYAMEKGDCIDLTFPTEVTTITYYIAPIHNPSFTLQAEKKDGTQLTGKKLKFDTVFCWKDVSLGAEVKTLSMTLQSNEARLIELVFTDKNGNTVLPENVSTYPELFDEASLRPENYSFRNSTYFDEIYHARTAYEFLHGLRSYENTHPPLGKIFISIGVLIFGMNPFGWRIIGTLFGIAMLPILYLFAKKLTGDTPAAALTTFIFAFDFMHFTQTRIATIDVYVVFFVLLMYYYLFQFLTADFASASLKKLLTVLALCGTTMGLGVACKWTGVYAGLGMGILFFLHMGRILVKSTNKKSIVPVTLKTFFREPLGKRMIKVLLWCVLFFVLVPLVIYVLSYIPFRDNEGNGLIIRAIKNQESMYSYHSNLVAQHYFASPFYEWPIIVKPIWYYSGVLEGTLREGITSMGNPFVWWAGIPAFLYVLYLTIFRKDRRALFLTVGYLAQYLPWFFVTRLTFIYHYFPSTIFVVLMIGYTLRNLKDSMSKNGYIAILSVYALLVFALFILFYPVLAGQPVEVSFVTKYLRWFKEWFFVAT